MGRPPLILETWGKIRRTTIHGQPSAVAHYRDSDGATRKMQRQGKTPADAERNLIAAMKERLAPSSNDLTGDSTIQDLSVLWWAETVTRDLAPGTLVRYREALDRYVLKGRGDVRLKEASVPSLDRLLKVIHAKNGSANAKLAHVVLGGMFALAVRHGAIPSNPVRDVGRIVSKRNPVVAPDLSTVFAIRARLHAWDAGLDHYGRPRTTDLGDVADMMIATGLRTGEVLALKWSDIDLTTTPATVSSRHTIALGLDGRLTFQEFPKSDSSNRTLALPPFAAEMLLRRRVAAISEWLFPSRTDTWRSPNNFRTMWRSALKGTDSEGISPKAFRKAVATLIDQRLGRRAASDQLGHASEQITTDHYIQKTHLGPAGATEVLQEFFVTSAIQNRD